MHYLHIKVVAAIMRHIASFCDVIMHSAGTVCTVHRPVDCLPRRALTHNRLDIAPDRPSEVKLTAQNAGMFLTACAAAVAAAAALNYTGQSVSQVK